MDSDAVQPRRAGRLSCISLRYLHHVCKSCQRWCEAQSERAYWSIAVLGKDGIHKIRLIAHLGVLLVILYVDEGHDIAVFLDAPRLFEVRQLRYDVLSRARELRQCQDGYLEFAREPFQVGSNLCDL